MSSSDDEARYPPGELSEEQAAIERQKLEEELNKKFPNRPFNRSPTLPFHVLYQDLFGPLIDNLQRKATNRPAGRKAGPGNVPSNSPHEIRRGVIERFISRWRRDVGDDIFLAMRLIIPEKDRERAMYGLKEKVLARYLVKLMKIDKNSEDGFNLLNWKLPGQNAAARNAGDFAGRCYEVLCKRAYRIDPGNMSIEEVNKQLDLLSREAKEEKQMPVMETFYKNMNADEMTWLIRIILRNMKIGATERTILDVWHPDAEALFNVSSSLRRVCWELYDPKIRLESDERGVKLFECYLPQLAHQPNMSFNQMVATMKPSEEDPEFWIEEKLDGERMQVHISKDLNENGEKYYKFKFWSRKSKDYTYLYGDSFEEKDSALTQYIKDGFKDGVENAILDGEMITWNMEQDMITPFGTLKTAALEQKNNSQFNERPFYRVFDILLLNGKVLTRYTLRDRRKALEATINNVHRRMEILPYRVATQADEIETSLREVIERASEGLVVKNPRSAYILNARLADWVKVKPEYMTEFGESLDCLIIGGFYGSGHRGGELSSFLCGLREDRPDGKKRQKFLSFFKIGGGMTTDDFKKLRHNTEGKWHKFNSANPPSEYLELAKGLRQVEKPDMWIKPEDSVVVEAKAASVNPSDEYAVKVTLRFPRFTRFRTDKNWETALSVEEFQNLKTEAETKAEENKKELLMNKRKQRNQSKAPRKKQAVIAGYDGRDTRQPATAEVDTDAVKSKVFTGYTFYIMTECSTPEKKTKIELEQMVKENGGSIVQSAEIKGPHPKSSTNTTPTSAEPHVLCIAERRTVKVASLEKRGKKDIVKPIWLFDCIRQGARDFAKGSTEIVLPYEAERHLFFITEEAKSAHDDHVDRYGDSYARDTDADELKQLMASMEDIRNGHDVIDYRELLGLENCRGWILTDLVIWFDDAAQTSNGEDKQKASSSSLDVVSLRISAAKITAQFAGAKVVENFDDESVTHVVLNSGSQKRRIRKEVAKRKRLPRIVTLEWIEACWEESTRIDEERYAVL